MAPNASRSNAKLFLHLHRGGANRELAGWRDQLGVYPEWVKALARVHCLEVKAVDPGIKTLLRDVELSMDTGRYLVNKESGRQFFRDLLARAGGTLAGVDALEFMNEKTSFNDIDMLARNNAAAMGFVEMCLAAKVSPVVHNAAFANPRPDLMQYLAESIKAALNLEDPRPGATRGYFGLHCYGPRDLFDGAAFYVECYLAQMAELARLGVFVPPGRVLITEFGHDKVTDPNYTGPSGAWRNLGIGTERLADEYNEYNRRLMARGIGGAFVYDWFTYDNPDDRGYEHVPYMLEWYGGLMAAHIGPPVPPPTPDPPPGAGLKPWVVWPAAQYTAANVRRAAAYQDASGATVYTTFERGLRVYEDTSKARKAEPAGGEWVPVQTWVHSSVLRPAALTAEESAGLVGPADEFPP